jgi:hypothetical protein
VSIRSDKYIIRGKTDGPCYFKAIVQTVEPDTYETANFLRAEIQQDKMRSFLNANDKNVLEMGLMVQRSLQRLAGMGEASDMKDIKIRYFNVCKEINHKDFHHAVLTEAAQSRTLDKAYSLVDGITALNEAYLHEVNKGTWNKPSQEEVAVRALSAQLTAMQAQADIIANETKITPTKATKTKAKWNLDAPENAWKLVAPKANESWSKLLGDSTWEWCDFHAKWARHKADKCTARVNANQGPPPPHDDSTPPPSPDKDLRSMAKTLMALFDLQEE